MQSVSKRQESDELCWYAAKVFYNRTHIVEEKIAPLVAEIYIPRKVISSLVFIKTSVSQIKRIQKEWYGYMKVYTMISSREPYPIRSHDMDVFMLVTSLVDKKMQLMDPSAVNYKEGEKVRVTGGIFKGAEGYIKRIRGDKRLVVCIEGIIAVATSYIPSVYLEKIEN